MALNQQRPKSSLHGILIVDKPGSSLKSSDLLDLPDDRNAGLAAQRLLTSHDIVQKVRRWSGQRRIGHTGTLDPMASGVLVLCLGLATRLVEYYQGHAKQYYAEIALGTATDTYDAMGTVVAEGVVPPLSLADVEAALARFRGEIQQMPPVYSALKQGGESAHRRARRGETVELVPRRVTFYNLELVDILAPDRIVLRAHCSAGTYIRSLAYDLGQALGVPAHLAHLRREAAGAFTLDDACSLAAIEAAAEAGELEKLLHSAGDRLVLPRYTLDEAAIRAFGYGQNVILEDDNREAVSVDAGHSARGPAFAALPADASLAQAYREDGQFLGIIRRLKSEDASASLWKAEKWLVVDGETL